MSTENPVVGPPKWMHWVGWVLTVLPAALLTFSGVMKLVNPPGMAEQMEKTVGWSGDLAFGLGIVELGCTLLYLIPRTTVLGAILLTGYMGGAIATHVRVGDPVYLHCVIGVVIWLGVYLRDARLRELIPWRR